MSYASDIQSALRAEGEPMAYKGQTVSVFVNLADSAMLQQGQSQSVGRTLEVEALDSDVLGVTIGDSVTLRGSEWKVRHTARDDDGMIVKLYLVTL